MIGLAEEINVLMIGNNPLELAKVFAHLNSIPGKEIITETAFDLKSGLRCLSKFKPNFIILDDNLGRLELTNAVQWLSRYKQTRNIPITILKNSNYQEAFSGVGMNYVLKSSLSGPSLYNSLKNSLLSSRTQRLLKAVYKKRKGQLKRLIA
jgi:DNA-binding response OmpR family regulator